MAYKPGTVNDFSNSMAQAIENALKAEWPNVMGEGSPDSNPQLKLLCVAIAQGVIKYLRDHAASSIDVKTTIGGSGTYDGDVTIHTSGTVY